MIIHKLAQVRRRSLALTEHNYIAGAYSEAFDGDFVHVEHFGVPDVAERAAAELLHH